MATCPVCQAAIEITAQHHGTLFTCPSCSAVFFVDWSGQPEVAETAETAAPSEESSEPPAYEPMGAPSFDAGIESSEYAHETPQPFDSNFQPVDTPGGEGENHNDFSEGVSANYDFNSPLTAEPFSSPEASAETPADSVHSLADIADFGNAETTLAAFHYTVTISGIDTATVRTALRDALTDSKFAWDLPELLAQIKDGSLTIRSVSAVKAGILIQRIKFLPVKISWRQDVLSGGL